MAEPDAPPRDEELVETGKITIHVGLNSEGTRSWYSIDGMDLEPASGYVRSALRAIEQEVDDGWFADSFLLTIDGLVCPHCDEEITVEDFREDEDE